MYLAGEYSGCPRQKNEGSVKYCQMEGIRLKEENVYRKLAMCVK